MVRLLKNIKLGWKITLAFSVVVATILAMSAVIYTQLQIVHQGAQDADRTHVYLRYLAQAIGSNNRQLSLLRGYLMSWDDAYIKDLNQEKARFDQDLNEIESRLSSAVQREHLKKIRALSDSWHTEFIDVEIGLGTDPATRPQALSMMKIGSQTKQLADLRKETDAFSAAGTEILQQRSDAEEAANSFMQRVLATGCCVAIVLSILIGWMLGFLVAKPLRRLVASTAELGRGKNDIVIADRNRHDEIGIMAKALEQFREAAVHSSALRKSANMNSSALDACRTNVMLADENYTIVFMNKVQIELLKTAEDDLRKELPQFEAGNLIGKPIDIFHKNPSHQRRMLDALTEPYETDIKIGVRHFHLIATPVFDGEHRMGTVVEWRDDTLEKSVQGEIDTIVKAAVDGDFSRRVDPAGKSGFMLTLATSMNALSDTVANVLGDFVTMLGALSEGNLTSRILKDYRGTFQQLKTDANNTAQKLSETMANIKLSATEVSNAAVEISASTTDLSQRTEEQAASLEQTSASMEEISSTVKKNAENAQRANQLTSSSREVADRGGGIVANAVEAMARIEDSSRKIADIISVIDEIARQTNLLALNAAVEAARAGDAGRGFAVVASEVRSLAQRASQAAKDIKDLITSSSAQVKDGVGLVNQAGASLKEIVGSIKEVAALVADIATASGEQAEGLDQINKALAQMDEVTQQNSALVEQNAASAKALEHQSTTMGERVGFFKIERDSNANSGRDSASHRAAAAA
jgi:methyl-accepting chemotaxis protein